MAPAGRLPRPADPTADRREANDKMSRRCFWRASGYSFARVAAAMPPQSARGPGLSL